MRVVAYSARPEVRIPFLSPFTVASTCRGALHCQPCVANLLTHPYLATAIPGGSTVCCVFVRSAPGEWGGPAPLQVVCANAGDSRAILCSLPVRRSRGLNVSRFSRVSAAGSRACTSERDGLCGCCRWTQRRGAFASAATGSSPATRAFRRASLRALTARGRATGWRISRLSRTGNRGASRRASRTHTTPAVRGSRSGWARSRWCACLASPRAEGDQRGHSILGSLILGQALTSPDMHIARGASRLAPHR